MDKELRLGQMQRDCQGVQIRLKRDAEQPVRLSFSASSETPVERYYGTEILSHKKGAMRTERLERRAVPLLFNHNWNDPIGMVDVAELRDRRLEVDEAHLFDTERARDVAKMVDGGLRNISIGYQPFVFEEEVKTATFTAVDWELHEISIVSVPADSSVGIGRSQDDSAIPVRVVAVGTSAQATTTKGVQMDASTTAAAGSNADTNVTMGTDHAAQERLRILGLQALARTHNIAQDMADGWVQEGTTCDEAARKVLDIIAERSKKAVRDNPSHLNLSRQEIQQYSITRAIKACVEKSWPKVAPYEAEVSKSIAQRLGKAGGAGEHTFFVPLEVQWMAAQQRDMIAGTSSLGGYLVGTNVLSFIEVLRNRSVAMRLGATTLPGLQGSVSIPKQLTAASANWFASEAGTATESTPTWGQIALTPKTVSGYVEIGRNLLLQATQNVEGIINADLAKVVALAVDLAAIAGPGTGGQPTGIVATSGVGTANPATGTAITYADMIKFQTTVANSNAMMPGFGYVTTPTVAGILMGKPRFTNSDTPIWGGNILEGQLVGAMAMSSLQVGSGSMLAGDFSQVVIGEWGVLEIEANPYAQFQAGIVGVRALYTVDVGVRNAVAFALGTGMTG